MKELESLFWAYVAHEKGATICPEKKDIEAIKKIINYYLGGKK